MNHLVLCQYQKNSRYRVNIYTNSLTYQSLRKLIGGLGMMSSLVLKTFYCVCEKWVGILKGNRIHLMWIKALFKTWKMDSKKLHEH